jgi:aryl-alcohol dehydrogenase-like predicted oxidoreductase
VGGRELAKLTTLTEHYRYLGQTQLLVSPVGLGTVKIGRNQNVKNKVADGFDLPSDQTVAELLTQALDLGINFIDTAPAYGDSEAVLGRVLGSRRKQFVISTKVGEEYDGKASHYDFTASHIRMSIERSLVRLKTDYLDSVLVHCPPNDLDILAHSPVLEILARLKEQGQILSFGASTKTVEGGLYAADHCDTVMLSFNQQYQAEADVIRKCMANHKGVLVIKALLQGHLDKVSADDPLAACFRAVYDLCPSAVVVVGTVSLVHLRENVASAVRALKR